MAWVEVFAVFVVCHLVGDYLLQTDWQAHPQARRAWAPTPWRAARCCRTSPPTRSRSCRRSSGWPTTSAPGVLWVAALIAVPHLIQDDGRLLGLYMSRVKG